MSDFISLNTLFKYIGTSKDVIIPEGIECLDSNCFCFDGRIRDFTSITLPSTIKKINPEVFSDLHDLKEVKFHPDCTLQKIPSECFANCKSLENINLPSTIELIEDGAFYNCKELKSIKIPNACTRIENDAFRRCKNLKEINLENTKYIGENCFKECNNLKNIVLNEGLEIIKESAFESCTSLKSVILPKSLKNDLDLVYVFLSCKSLETIYILTKNLSINELAFDECDNLKTIFVPKSSKKYYEDRLPYFDVLTIDNISLDDILKSNLATSMKEANTFIKRFNERLKNDVR